MASFSADDNIINPIQRLHQICSQKSLDLRFHDIRFISTNSYNASATVNDITIQGRASNIHAAKEKAANRMIAYLVLNDNDANNRKTAEDTEEQFPSNENNAENLNNPVSSMSSSELDESSRDQRELQKVCLEKNLTFKYHDCRDVSTHKSPLFSASLTINDATIERRGQTLKIAKNKAAEHMVSYLRGNKNIELLHPSKKLYVLCKERRFVFEYVDVKCLSEKPPMYTATARVLDTRAKSDFTEGRKEFVVESITSSARTFSEARFKAASELLRKLGWNQQAEKTDEITNHSMTTKSFQRWTPGKPENREKEMLHPCSRLQDLCQKRGLRFQFSDTQCLSLNPAKYIATAAVKDVRITAEGTTLPKAKAKCATEILEKLGWEKEIVETKEVVFESQAENDLNKPQSSLSSSTLNVGDSESSREQRDLQKICSEKNLTFEYHNCHAVKTDKGPMFNAALTVNGVTIERRGLTLQVAKNKAAKQMIEHLEQNPAFGQTEGNGNKGIELTHPSKKLYRLCEKRGLIFQYRDVHCLSTHPPKYSASATVLGVTVTAEGPTFSEARFNVATELLRKLGWDKEESEATNSGDNMKYANNTQNIPSQVKSTPSTQNTVQRQLQDLCSKRNLFFKFHSCRALSTNPPNFNACLTVNDITIARKGKSIQGAKDEATIAMIDHLNGKSVEFGYETRRGYRNMSKNPTEQDLSCPSYRLCHLCKQKGIYFQFDVNEIHSKSLNRYTASATIRGVTVTAEGNSWIEVKRKVATQMLSKLGWDETVDETTKGLKNTSFENNSQNNSFLEKNVKEEFEQHKVFKPLVGMKSTEEKLINSKPPSSNATNAHPLFNNKKKSDITFIVGRPGEQVERVYGHSLIICLASPVLDELLEGDWKDKEEVKIQAHPASFLSIMRYVYSQDIVIEKHYLIETLILAKKYGLTRFTEELVTKNYLTEGILKDNIWSLLEFAYQENEDEIWHQAASFFDKQCEGLIRDNSFFYLDVDVLTSLIQRPSLNVEELSLFYATILWAGKRCEEEGLEASGANLRSMIEPFIRDIRFPLMTGDEFREGPGMTGILTGDECYKILCAICLGDKEDCGFSFSPRLRFSNTNSIKTEDSFLNAAAGENEDHYDDDSLDQLTEDLRNTHMTGTRPKEIITHGKYAGLTPNQKRAKLRSQKRQREFVNSKRYPPDSTK